MITVRERMRAPVISVGESTKIAEIAEVLETKGISAVAVVDAAQRLCGVVSSTDVVRAFADSSAEALTAKDVMCSPVVIATPHEPLEDAAFRMVAARVHRLFVLDGEELVGVLTARDVLEGVRSRRVHATLGAIMSTPVLAVSVDDSIQTCIARLATASVHGLVVLDGTWPVGVFTHTEVIAARRRTAVERTAPVHEIMSYETICLDVGTPIQRAARHVVAMDVRRILVVEDRELVGIASVIDLVGVLARAPQEISTEAVALLH
jgi:CBS domain-containing protein